MRQHQVRLDATTVVWYVDRGSSSSRSLLSGVVRWIGTVLSLSHFYLSIFYPYHMLALEHNSNKNDRKEPQSKTLNEMGITKALIAYLETTK